MGFETSTDKLQITSIKRGTVIDNNHPGKNGMVKIRVHQLMENVDEASIPWAKPMWSAIIGASADVGLYGVPYVGSEVYVMFEKGDPMAPIYIGCATDGVHGQPSFKDADYPNTRGIKFANGFEVSLNETQDLFRISHPAGSIITIDKDGKIVLSTPDSVSVEALAQIIGIAGVSVSFTAPNISMTGTYGMRMDCPATVTIEAPTFRVTGNPVFDVGWTGVFSTGSGQAVTVTNGIITEIA